MYLNYMILSLINFLILIVLILMSVAFLTLLERKILGYIQNRKGPNKLLMIGLFQPFADAIKLLSKENMKLTYINYLYFYFCPIMLMFISMMMWMLVSYMNFIFSIYLSVVFILCCMSLSLYFFMISGWSSNSSYSLLGSIRSIAQAISYEVSFIFIMISLFLLSESLMFFNLLNYQTFFYFIYLFPLGLMFYISILAELNRTPFDLIEGESELVSGFNVEYFSGGFTLLFMSEYMNIIFMSYLFVNLFFGSFSFMMFIMILLVMMSIIWIRGVLPRIRYDKLMNLCWLKFLPISMNYLIFVYSIKVFLF